MSRAFSLSRVVLAAVAVAIPSRFVAAQPAEARWKGKPTGHWISRLAEENPSVRRQAVQALAALGADAKTAVPSLIRAMDDTDDAVREGAMAALGRIGPAAEEAVPALLRALPDKDLRYCEIAVQALGGIGPAHEAVVPALVATALGTDPARRRVASAAGVASPCGR